MSIPDFQSLMLPLLEAVGDGKDHSNAEITKALAQQFGVTENELQETLPSGPSKLFYNRVGPGDRRRHANGIGSVQCGGGGVEGVAEEMEKVSWKVSWRIRNVAVA